MTKPKIHKKPTTTTTITKHVNQNQCQQQPQKSTKQHSWALFRGLLTCKDVLVQNQQKNPQKKHVVPDGNNMKCKKMICSGSLCNSTKVMARHAAENRTNDAHKKRVSSLLPLVGVCNKSSNASTGSMKLKASPQKVTNGVLVSSSSSSLSASSNYSANGSASCRGMPFGRISGCYECRMVVNPVLGFTRDHCSICSCPHCGEIFSKADNLKHHQATKHSVSELGPEDTSKNIVEIMFYSNWLKKQPQMCKIEHILKVHNTLKTISKFEEYRESIKAKATRHSKKNPRCVADGNELLRFYCTTFTCSLGQNGYSNICNNYYASQCNVCSIIRNGFKVTASSNVLGESSSSNGDGVKGILTMGTSGKAHDKVAVVSENNNKRAMLICRVIAGRVKKNNDKEEGGIDMEEYDSIAGGGANEAYSNLDELYVFNHSAILPCFVVIYRGF